MQGKNTGSIFWLLSFLWLFFSTFYIERVRGFWVWGIARSNPQINVLPYKDNFSKPSSFALYGSLANAPIYNLWWIVAYVLTVFCRQMWAYVPAWLEAMCLWLGWAKTKLLNCTLVMVATVDLLPGYVTLRYFQMQLGKADVLLQKMDPSFH